MTSEEKTKTIADLQQVRYEIDLLYGRAFTEFVQAVHALSLMLNPIVKNQEALAYKLIEIETKLRSELENEQN